MSNLHASTHEELTSVEQIWHAFVDLSNDHDDDYAGEDSV